MRSSQDRKRGCHFTVSNLETLLAIFQLAHYDHKLFGAWLERHKTPRQWAEFELKAAWSAKARLLFLLASPLALIRPQGAPTALLLAAAVLQPLESLLAVILSIRARRRLNENRPRTAIGITGSYGKTTTKEIIAAILSPKFRVHKTPESINTFLGIARWLAKTPLEKNSVLVVEMGSYRIGDIAGLAPMLRPNIGVLTGINEAHLERFGSIKNTQAAKCELFDSLPSGGRGFWNQGSELCREAVAARAQAWEHGGLKLIPYSEAGVSDIEVKAGEPSETSLKLEITKKIEPRWAIETEVKLIGKHHRSSLAVAVALADELGLSAEEIRQGLADLQPLERRLQPSHGPGGTLLIDDSYNITLDGVKAALEALKPIQRRKIGVFAGIPEAGESSAALNQTLGRLIAPVFDILVLRKTPAEKAILDGLQTVGWNIANLIRYTEKDELEPLLAKVIRPQDCVYFSAYDWPAIYL